MTIKAANHERKKNNKQLWVNSNQTCSGLPS